MRIVEVRFWITGLWKVSSKRMDWLSISDGLTILEHPRPKNEGLDRRTGRRGNDGVDEGSASLLAGDDPV